jgi:hypothetical protein
LIEGSILHFEPENVNFLDFNSQFMAFGRRFERFEVRKIVLLPGFQKGRDIKAS